MAAPEQLFPQITQICDALGETELRMLAYLCGSTEADHSEATVRDVLRSALGSCERPEQFLRELLLQLRRLDLLKRLFGCGRAEVEALRSTQGLPRFRILMASVGEEITKEDLSKLKFLLGSVLPRDRLERAKCFLDVITELEKQDNVSCERVELIENCLRDIGRFDLAKKVRTVTGPEQHTSQLQRCRPAWPNPVQQLCPQLTRRVQLIHNGAGQTRPPSTREQSCPMTIDHYKLNTKPRGVCVIIDCVGHDGELLEQTFRRLHFSVLLHRWPRVSECLSALRGLVSSPVLRAADAFVCCIISRGNALHLLATDAHCTGLHLDTLRKIFAPDQCPALAGKPKLFFIQRYSVPEYQPSGQRSYIHSDEELETDGVPGQSLVPIDADVFWSHCWTDESQLQQKQHHSYYLKTLTEALHRGQSRKANLVDVHTEVNAAIFDYNRKNPSVPYHLDLKHTLRKNLYLQ